MTKDREYRYFVKPLTPEANEAIASWLNARAEAAQSLEHMTIVVNDEPVEGVYEVRHLVLTELLRSVHKRAVRAYVQEGAGKVRLYRLYDPSKGRLGKTKAVRAVRREINKLAGR